MEQRYREQEIEIDLKDLFYRVALKWRMMIVIGIVCAILACAYQIFSNFTNNRLVDDYYAFMQLEEEEKKDEEAAQNVYESAAAKAKKEALETAAESTIVFANLTEDEIRNYYYQSPSFLTDEEKQAVEDAIFAYGSLLEAEAYNKDSIWINLDYNAVGTGYAVYHVNTGHTTNYAGISEDDYRSAIMDAYISYINNSTKIKGIDWSDDISYIRELFNISQTTDGNMLITTYGKDEDAAKELLDAIVSMLVDYNATLNEQIGTHELKKISKIFDTRKLLEVRNAKDDALANVNAAKANMKAFYAGFNIYQACRFYFEVQSNYPGEKVEINDIMRENADYTTTYKSKIGEIPERRSIISKTPMMAVIGFIVGLFLVIIIYAMVYILNGKIKSGREVSDAYGFYLIGTMEAFRYVNPKKHTFIDRWIYSWKNRDKDDPDNRREYISKNTRLMCEKADVKSVTLTSTEALDEKGISTAESVKKELEAAGIKAEIGQCAGKEVTTVEKLAQSGKCVLIEQIDISRRNDISEAVDFAAAHKVDILGVIAV